jgi:hypothetical protein
MIFMTAVSVGMLPTPMVLLCWPRKMPGVSCRIRPLLALGLHVKVCLCRSHRRVLVPSSKFQVFSLFPFHHLFAP